MDSTIEAVRIENLETRLGLRWFQCKTLELELELAATEERRTILARRWAEAMKGCVVLQLALEILKRLRESGSWDQ
ncbi:MAG: hypothetical protein WBA18_05385 [Terracidiphilus sp.]